MATLTLQDTNIADKYVGKSIKYLSIFDKSLKKAAVKPNSGTFTVDNLIDILTPSKLEDIPAGVVVGKLSDNSYSMILSQTKTQFEKIICNLQTNYWKEITSVVSSRKNWDPLLFITEVLRSGNTISESRNYRAIYDLLIDLYGLLNVLRTIEDSVDRCVLYLEFDYD